MNWKKLGQAIAEHAPLLGAVLPIPGAKVVCTAVAEAFGADDNDPADIAAKIAAAGPEAYVKLREIETAHAEEIGKLAQAQMVSELADRQDARQRELALAGSTGRRDWMQLALATAIVVGFLAICVVVFRTGVKTEMKDLAMVVIGVIAKIVSDIYAYYFGSSDGSRRKTEIMAGVAGGQE